MVLDLLREQSVGADDDVNGARSKALEGLSGLFVGLEPREGTELNREPRETILERLEVLLDEQRRWHEHRDLLVVLHGFERRTHRDLGLAEAHVTRDEAIHGNRLLHVALDVVDRG